ncbi:hypothetical protein [Bradyrhizobium sp. RDT46]|uniref:hypothetical protein n=1 Tax=Bradyrhizobium sp. RDT46 TaxID=3341829 RepID=UPI0035C670E7
MIGFPNYRHLARESLTRAKAELATQDLHRLRYAALELRDAMEAVTYDRALAFKDEIPPEEYRTWQPRKLMAVLVDIDPSIGMTSTIAVGIESECGKQAENLEILGTDQVLTLKDIKSHYDAIGSHLHMPSLEQLEAGKIADPAKLRTRCEAVVAALESVLGSPVYNVTLGNFAQLTECMNEACRRPVRKRIPHGKTEIEAECFECKAIYTLVAHPGGAVEFKPKTTLVGCPSEGCSETFPLWPHELTPGTHWRCRCGSHNGIALGAHKIEEGPAGEGGPG